MPTFLSWNKKKPFFSKFYRFYPHYQFLVLFAAKNWRRKANFPFARTDNSVMVPLLVPAFSLVSDSGIDDGGGVSVKRKAFSIRTI